jgi:hypothetical protein
MEVQFRIRLGTSLVHFRSVIDLAHLQPASDSTYSYIVLHSETFEMRYDGMSITTQTPPYGVRW